MMVVVETWEPGPAPGGRLAAKGCVADAMEAAGVAVALAAAQSYVGTSNSRREWPHCWFMAEELRSVCGGWIGTVK